MLGSWDCAVHDKPESGIARVVASAFRFYFQRNVHYCFSRTLSNVTRVIDQNMWLVKFFWLSVFGVLFGLRDTLLRVLRCALVHSICGDWIRKPWNLFEDF